MTDIEQLFARLAAAEAELFRSLEREKDLGLSLAEEQAARIRAEQVLAKEIARRRKAEREAQKAKKNEAAAIEKSMRDGMTGLINKATGAELLDRLYHEILRDNIAPGQGVTKEPQTIILIAWDIDHFKSVNDKLGHEVGDEVIANVAAQAKKQFGRSTDLIVRDGGEEFFAAIKCDQSKSKDIALFMAEELRAAIEANCAVGERIITGSLGVSWLTPTDIDKNSKQAIYFLKKRADMALYAAKENGRNAVWSMNEDGQMAKSHYESQIPSGAKAIDSPMALRA